MFFEIARIAKHHKPKVLFLENVQGLLSHEKGKTFKTIVETLQDLGYTVHHKVLRSKDFGVPQLRPRLFIIALANTASFVFPEPLNIKTCVGDILENKVDSKYFLSDKAWTSFQLRKRFNKSLGKGFGFNLISKDAVHTNTLTARYGKDGSEVLIKSDRDKRYLNLFDENSEHTGTLLCDANENLVMPSATICANGGGLAAKTGAYLINNNPRKLTPRECARLQGYPDSFIIPVSDTQAYKQFGNSVTVNVVKAIAQKIKETYEKL
jgi:DNA (cytosine-5)-methyltransferase 1